MPGLDHDRRPYPESGIVKPFIFERRKYKRKSDKIIIFNQFAVFPNVSRRYL